MQKSLPLKTKIINEVNTYILKQCKELSKIKNLQLNKLQFRI